MKVPYTYDDSPDAVDVDIWMPVMKALIKKYGNFNVSQDLHNMIIRNLCEICNAIKKEQQ